MLSPPSMAIWWFWDDSQLSFHYYLISVGNNCKPKERKRNWPQEFKSYCPNISTKGIKCTMLISNTEVVPEYSMMVFQRPHLREIHGMGWNLSANNYEAWCKISMNVCNNIECGDIPLSIEGFLRQFWKVYELSVSQLKSSPDKVTQNNQLLRQHLHLSRPFSLQ